MANQAIALTAAQQKRLDEFNNKLKMTFWLISKLPSAWFMRVSIKKVTAERAEVQLPFSWCSQNPFQSIYFAAQCAAAELSTGALAILALTGRGQVSMLVSHISADFVKKANDTTIFTCEDGAAVFETVEKAITTREPQTITMTSTGRLPSGEVVSITRITWSFKAK